MENDRPDWPIPSAYAKSLAIIVPYRDRQEHLAYFLPHMLAYFERDKLGRHINYAIHVIEQLDDEPFNRGRLNNAGFALARKTADYFCFHDVDYLPIWADYSYVDQPTRLIWHGLTLGENYEQFFGAVTAFNRKDFELVNGYSNEYWGWGYEDTDLRLRCTRAGLAVGLRDGSFQSLPHTHRGYKEDGTQTEEALQNAALYREKSCASFDQFTVDGWTSLKFEQTDMRLHVCDGKPLPHVQHHYVRWR